MHQKLATWLAAFAIGVVAVPTTTWAQSPTSQSAPGQAKKYRATSPIVKDQATGQRRMPTEQEVTDLVATLERVTAQATSPATATSGTAVTLDAGYEGLVLARVNEDGAVETRCVYSFEEGAAFLGLVLVEVQ